MNCPICHSKKIRNGYNSLNESVCVTCGCEFHKHTKKVFKDGDINILSESVKNFISDNITNPSLIRSLRHIVDCGKKEPHTILEGFDNILHDAEIVGNNDIIPILKSSINRIKIFNENIDPEGNIDSEEECEDEECVTESEECEDEECDNIEDQEKDVFKETREMVKFLKGKVRVLKESHLDNNIKEIRDALEGIEDKLKELEDEYHRNEAPCEDENAEENEDMGHEEEETEEVESSDDSRKEEIETEISKLQDELEKLNESILRNYFHGVKGEDRNIPYVGPTNDRFGEARPYPEGVDKFDDKDPEAKVEESEHGDSYTVKNDVKESKENKPDMIPEGSDEYYYYGGINSQALNEQFSIGDTVVLEDDLKKSYRLTKIKDGLAYISRNNEKKIVALSEGVLRLQDGTMMHREREIESLNSLKKIYLENYSDDVIPGENRDYFDKMDAKDSMFDDDIEKAISDIENVFSVTSNDEIMMNNPKSIEDVVKDLMVSYKEHPDYSHILNYCVDYVNNLVENGNSNRSNGLSNIEQKWVDLVNRINSGKNMQYEGSDEEILEYIENKDLVDIPESDALFEMKKVFKNPINKIYTILEDARTKNEKVLSKYRNKEMKGHMHQMFESKNIWEQNKKYFEG